MPSYVVNLPALLRDTLEREAARVKDSPSKVVAAAIGQYLGTPAHTVFQVSTSGALVAGVYAGVVSVRTILNHGDFGLGTFANLDGEMVVLDGLAYQVRGTGRVSVADRAARIRTGWARRNSGSPLDVERMTPVQLSGQPSSALVTNGRWINPEQDLRLSGQ
ncbi:MULTISPECIES: acetolactate decarboxylase [unclassified Rhizobium]|uniref:acetolactate decarboxylase n=1 Tax=unclassified Rhizobium TaxID=2613769 RepID=UPI001042C5E0|nr:MULTISPECIES: acetolactate decarboxylase [unclassified Rhizobium]MBB3397017.1 hypothetical protein [Rhizobium sp. BK060]MBB4170757.1 hypothetical protein [Rhizobium sp. BK538]TCM75973.1 alpha-acetolactate decarboxylase [Rhizobium sp. BK068]